MGRLNHKIRAGTLGGNWIQITEAKMRAVSFVHDQRQRVLLARFRDRCNVRDSTKVCWIEGNERFGMRRLLYGLRNRGQRQTVTDSKAMIPSGHHPLRYSTGMDDSSNDRLMRIARDENGITRRYAGHDCSHVAQAGTAHQHETTSHPVGHRQEFFSFANRTARAVQRIGIGQVIQVAAGPVGRQFARQAPTTFMSRTIKRCLKLLTKALNVLPQRRTFVISGGW